MKKIPPPNYKDFQFDLGAQAQCMVTGATGIITNRSQNLDGTNTYWIQPSVEYDNKVPERICVDEALLTLTTEEEALEGVWLNCRHFAPLTQDVSLVQPKPLPENPQPL